MTTQQNVEKMSITLPAEMVRLIREKVDAGTYASNSEVIRTAIRGWMEQESRLAILDAAIARGLKDAEAGNSEDVATVRQELMKRRGQ